MDIDKLNAFLATAIGGIIFKWLAGVVKSCWSWLHKIHPEERFLIDDLNLNAPAIRITYCKYKKSTKPKTTRSKYIQITFGIIIIFFCIYFFYGFAKIITNGPIQWISYTHNLTKDKIWINAEKAKNPENNEKWGITPQTCLIKNSLSKINDIKEETKSFICNYLLDSESREKLKKITDRNFLSIMAMTPVVLFTILYFMSLGFGMIMDVHITQKISKYNQREAEKSYDYLT